jgi:mono/diheme cytochrome c family protein
MMERMKQRGMEIGSGAANEMAKQAQEALVQRLHNGGTDMPSFSYLSEDEDHALIEYLKQLSGVPGAKQMSIAASPTRTGELVVKSTCNICHGATGLNPTAAQLEDGAIPPLQTLTTRTDESQFIRKVTSGAPILMGTPPTMHRGRMPVFYYLSADEVADAYLYLTTCPPSPFSAATPVVAASQTDSRSDATSPDKARSLAPLQAAVIAPVATTSDGISDAVVTLSLIGLGAMMLVLICGGLVYCGYEICRLGHNGEESTRQRPSAVIMWPSKSNTPSPNPGANESKETIHVAS